jgi:hypothetical protein
LVTDLGKLISGKIKEGKQESTFTLQYNDSNTYTSKPLINARGKMRRKICHLPPLRLNFGADTTSPLRGLKSLKLVSPCDAISNYEQLLIKEYLVYKMYNLISDKSFRVRLMQVSFEDALGKKKGFKQYAFFMEDVDELAKRHNCEVVEGEMYLTDATDRMQITLVSIFEYMIGNTDWSVPNNHNIKLIRPLEGTSRKPFAVPYDFDYSGIVDAPYATPDPELGLDYVTQRLYRGFPRNMAELEPLVQKFKDKKEEIYKVISDCKLLTPGNMKQMSNYLDDFFKMLERPNEIKSVFIDKARTS